MNLSTKRLVFFTFCLILRLVFPAGNCGARAEDGDYLRNGYWDSGKAEFQEFEGRIQQYGIEREAEARLVIVKEPFDIRKRAKTLGPDAIQVLKFNYFRHIPAGVYDYFQTASLFFDRRTGRVLKYTMSSQDGCGNTFMEYLRQPDGTHLFRYFSYFDDEGDSETVLQDGDFTFYDALPLTLRYRLKHGETYTLRLMESLIANKMQPLTLHDATVRVARTALDRKADSDVFGVSVQREDRTDRFFFDTAFPHRLIRWEMSNGDILNPTAADFFYYWEYTRPEHRNLLKRSANPE